MKCGYCGSDNTRESVVCKNCGAVLGKPSYHETAYKRGGFVPLKRSTPNVTLLVSWACFLVAMLVGPLFFISLIGVVFGVLALFRLNFWALIPIVLNLIIFVFGVLYVIGFTGFFFLGKILEVLF